MAHGFAGEQHRSLDTELAQRRISASATGCLHRRGEALVRLQHGADRLLRRSLGGAATLLGEVGQIRRLALDPDVTVSAACGSLAAAGLTARPNHVVVSHALLEGTGGPRPPGAGRPRRRSGRADAAEPDARLRHSARPAEPIVMPEIGAAAAPVHVAVLDSGMQLDGVGRVRSEWLRQAVAQPRTAAQWFSAPSHREVDDDDEGDADLDGLLDRVAGHGTFIAGLVLRHAPGATLHSRGAITSFGDGDDFSVAQAVDRVMQDIADGPHPAAPVILNMSFGGWTDADRAPIAFRDVIDRHGRGRDLVIVASAGNDATSRPTWPAAASDVIGVGAIGPTGPAWFSNRGTWVDAHAPGVDIVSTFLDTPAQIEIGGWARWSGTSFSAPIVAALIAAEVSRSGVGARTATHRLLHPRGPLRMPGLGALLTPPR